MNRKRSLILFGIVLTLLVSVGIANAQGPKGTGQPRAPRGLVGTAFTYQGQLKNNGAAVNGTCSFQFGLWDALSGGSQVSGTISQTLSVTVTNGLFTAPIDFGANAFNGDARYLGIAVNCGSGLTTLTSRQALTPAPMALALPGLYTQQNGGTPNLIGGYSGNTVMTGVYGATISGGGGSGDINQVTDYYGTVGGGSHNQAGDNDSILWNASLTTVSGGERNSASGDHATVGGGYGNTANGVGSVIAGGGATNFGGGSWGYFGNTASGGGSTIGGGMSNDANGFFSTIPGGYQNTASFSYTLAAGHRAKANNQGAFVWGDSTDADFASTANDQFLVRANGGVGINTNAPANASLQVAKDIAGSANYGQIEAIGANNNKRMTMGFDTTNNIGWLQASETGVAYRNLALDPNGGNVGVGTTTPQSKLQVVGNYIQFPTITGGAPPNTDCNNPAQYGRVVVRTDGTTNLYVCTASGWVGK